MISRLLGVRLHIANIVYTILQTQAEQETRNTCQLYLAGFENKIMKTHMHLH